GTVVAQDTIEFGDARERGGAGGASRFLVDCINNQLELGPHVRLGVLEARQGRTGGPNRHGQDGEAEAGENEPGHSLNPQGFHESLATSLELITDAATLTVFPDRERGCDRRGGLLAGVFCPARGG